MVLQPGDTFIIDDPGIPRYLWVVLAATPSGRLIAPIKESNPRMVDDSCVFAPRTLPTINRDSFVDYEFARELTDADWQRLVRCIDPKPPLSADLLNRVVSGARKSAFLPSKFKDLV